MLSEKKNIIKNIEEPTDIYIIGDDFTDKPETFAITDDYCSLTIRGDDGKEAYIETTGFVFILTKEEILNWKDYLDVELDPGYEDFTIMLLKDYVGEMQLVAEDDDGKDRLKENILELIKDRSRSYISDHTDDECNEWAQPVLNLSSKLGEQLTATEFLKLIE